MKKCFRCKEVKAEGFFFRHMQTADGLHSWCKQCCQAGNAKARAKKDSTIAGKGITIWRNARKSAEKRNQEFSITLADIIQCWNQQQQICAYTGREMTLIAKQLNTVSIERINSKIGYTPQNTILVCQAVNRMKSNFAYEDFYELCRDVTMFLSDDELQLAVGGVQ